MLRGGTVVAAACVQASQTPPSLPQMEAQILSAAVVDANGNLSQAARGLGISWARLAYRLDKHRLACQSKARQALR